jgi:hypothetical protein
MQNEPENRRLLSLIGGFQTGPFSQELCRSATPARNSGAYPVPRLRRIALRMLSCGLVMQPNRHVLKNSFGSMLALAVCC